MSDNKIKRIIVTGGSGFLGRHLCCALVKAEYEITNIDLRPFPDHNVNFETIRADVRESNKMMELIRGADLVFHLASYIEAGESVKNPKKYTQDNIDGTLSVLEAMRKNKIYNFIFSSSAAIYGEPIRVPIHEDDRTIPINPYGMTKLAMEGLLSSYVKAHGFTGVALRYFNLYGPEEHHQPETHAIPRFIKQVYEGQEVTVWGKGEHKRDYVFISDIVEAHLKAIELVENKPKQYHYMNLSAETPASVLDIVHLIEKTIGKKANIKFFDPRPGDPLLLYADASKARKVLSWNAKVGLPEGMEQVVNYFVKFWGGDI